MNFPREEWCDGTINPSTLGESHRSSLSSVFDILHLISFANIFDNFGPGHRRPGQVTLDLKNKTLAMHQGHSFQGLRWNFKDIRTWNNSEMYATEYLSWWPNVRPFCGLPTVYGKKVGSLITQRIYPIHSDLHCLSLMTRLQTGIASLCKSHPRSPTVFSTLHD